MKLISRSLILLASTFFVASCGVRQKSKPTGVLTIVALNDIHANIDQMPRLSFMVDSLRAVYPELLVLSSGDLQTGNPMNDYFTPRGEPIIKLMNDIGFCASAVGNHDFDPGQEGFAHLSHLSKFPFLGANVYPAAHWGINISPYKILTLKDGTRVSLLGVVQLGEGGYPESHPKNLTEITFTDPMEEIQRYSYLRDESDIWIALTHLGYEEDLRVAKRFPQIDLILGGHSHTLIEDPGTLRNGMMITQSGYKARYMTMVQLWYSGGHVVQKRAQLLAIDPHAGGVDAEMQQKVDAYNSDPQFAHVVTHNPAPIEEALGLGKLCADAYRWYTKSDFAYQNPGGVRISQLPAGDVTLKDIYRIDPFGNEMTIVTLTGEQLGDFMLHAWSLDRNIPAFLSGLRAVYRLDDTGVLLDCTLYKEGDTEPLDPQGVYRVAMSSYVQSVYPYQQVRDAENLGVTTAQVLVEYLSQTEDIGAKYHDGLPPYDVIVDRK